MSRHCRTKLVPPDPDPKKNHVLETVEESNQSEQIQEPVLTELDSKMEYPKCHEILELCSSFDKLMYWCDNCSFRLKWV
jgi:hypothetical protein